MKTFLTYQASDGMEFSSDTTVNFPGLKIIGRMSGKIALLFFALMLLAFSSLNAATVTSTGTGGAWATPGTWVGGLVPVASDNVVIAGPVTVGAMISQTGSITIHNGATLTVTVGVTVGTITIDLGGTLSSSGIIFLTGNLINSGTFSSSGDIWINGVGSQSIGGFTTTGTTSVQKQAGDVATLTGNVFGAGLSIGGGTLNLGSSLIHTFTGDINVFAGILDCGSSILNANSATAIALKLSGGTFTRGTGTINMGASGNQSIVGIFSFYNLSFSGSGTKTIPGALSITGTFSIVGTAVADLGSFTSSAQFLNLGGAGKIAGTWGGISSSAANKNGTWFNNATGIVSVLASSSCSGAGVWTGGVNSDWNTIGNWCNGTLPNNLTDVVITAVPNQPVIGNATLAMCRNLTINSGTNLTFSGLNPTLTVSGNIVNNGILNHIATGTVILNGAAQSISGNAIGFNNLTVSGSGVKTLTTVPTVYGTLSMESTGSLSVAPNYGPTATLQYNTSTARNAGVEWSNPFVAGGGIVIKNTGAITTPAPGPGIQIGDGTTSVPLTINTGATLVTSFPLNLFGDFLNSGTLTNGSTPILFSGPFTQSISGYATLGSTVMNKTGGIATFLGNVNGTNLIIFGSGGTLNLGNSLTHTFSGDVTLTAGSLNGGSSTLNLTGQGTSVWSGNGSLFNPGTGNVNFGAQGGQTLGATSTTFNNLSFTGSGTKKFASANHISGTLSISSPDMLDLGTAISDCNFLSIDGVGKTYGTWGGATSAAQHINPVFASNTGILTVITGSCPAGTWSGSTSTAWETASNWCSGTVPDATTDVVINSGGNQPIINSDAVCRNLTIQNGATLTISGSVTLTVGGNLTNNSTPVPLSLGGTVLLNGTAQTLSGNSIRFNNLTIGNLGVKNFTMPTFIVEGILSMEGTATVSAAPTYGTNATLQYNTATARTSGNEWVTPFTASGGIIIKNSGAITISTLPGVQIGSNSNVPLNINNGATLTAADHVILSLHGDFNNSGTINCPSRIDIGGNVNSQSIAGYTITGTTNLSKTGGSATFTGNVNCGGLVIDGSNGTLNLGNGRTHTVSGDVLLNGGTLNGGSSTLNITASSPTAWNGTGSVFMAGTGTVNFNAAGSQAIAAATTFNNLIFSNSGTKGFGAAITAGNFSVTGSAVADLGPGNSASTTLTLGGNGQQAGTWGGTHSAATNKNATWFADSPGVLMVASSTCSAGYWTGITSNDWSDPTNWCSGLVPDANTDVVINPGGHPPSITSDAICRNLTIQEGAILSIVGSNVLSIKGNMVNNSHAMLGFIEGTVLLNGTDQTIAPLSYNNLTLSGSNVKTFPVGGNTLINGVLSMEGSATASVLGNLIYGTGATLQYKGNIAQTTGMELILPFPAGGGIKILNTNGVTLGNAIDLGPYPLTIGDGLSNSIFSDGGYLVTSTGPLYLNSGTYYVKSSSFPAFGSRYFGSAGIVNYAATFSQAISGISYSNLTISGAGTNPKIATGDLTVNGILDLSSANASPTQGCLEMGPFTLNMGPSATTSGTGDVTGKVKRTNASFANGTSYSFGNQFTTLTFAGNPGGTKPIAISCKITLGTAPSWRAGAIQRIYTFSEDVDATDGIIANLHFLPAELNSNSASVLDLWDASGAGYTTIEEHGKSGSDMTNHSVTLSGLTMDYFAPSSNLDDKQWSLSNSTVVKNTWTGADGLHPTWWEVAANWSAGHVPLVTEEVLIPGSGYNPILTSAEEVKAIEIAQGGSLNAGNYDLTVNGYNDAFVNNGNFTSAANLVFSHGTASHIVTLSGAGTNNFNNLTVNSNTSLQLAAGSYLIISGNVSQGSGSTIDLTSTLNTVEYTGNGQNIINFQRSSSAGYSNLVFNGTGTKNLPATLNVSHDFTLNGGIVNANSSSSISILGNATFNNGVFNAFSSTIDVGGNWFVTASVNYGTSTITFNSSSADQSITSTLPLADTQRFYNLGISKSSKTLTVGGTIKTIQANNLTLTSGNFISPATLSLDGNATFEAGTTFTAGTYTDISGNWTNNNATFLNGNGTVVFKGSSIQMIGGTTSNVFANLTVNNTGGVSLNGTDATVGGTLTLTNGSLMTGANSIIVSNAAPIAISGGSSSSFINGNLRRSVQTGTNTYLFPIGTSSGYTPVSVMFTNVTSGGNLAIYSSNGVSANYPSGLNSIKKLARSWTITNSGIWASSGDATMTYLAGDLAGGATQGNLKAYLWSAGPVYAYPTTSTGTLSFTANGLTSYSEIGAGECADPTITLGASPSVCAGVTMANLTYGATTVNPDKYSITYDATALAQGFASVSNVSLPSSPIIQTVPAAAVAATYNATLTVKNSATGCTSSGYPITVTVNPILTASVGIVADNTTICAGTSVTFTATPVNGGTTPAYQWKVNGSNAGTNSATFITNTLGLSLIHI